MDCILGADDCTPTGGCQRLLVVDRLVAGFRSAVGQETIRCLQSCVEHNSLNFRNDHLQSCSRANTALKKQLVKTAIRQLDQHADGACQRSNCANAYSV
jgi:hypothetical protein